MFDGEQAGGAVLYADGFSGWSVRFTAGQYESDAIVAKGGRNNQVSSIVVDEGFEATLYGNDAFSGWAVKFTAGRYDLDAIIAKGGRNDDASSLHVIRVPESAFDISVGLKQHGTTLTATRVGTMWSANLAVECTQSTGQCTSFGLLWDTVGQTCNYPSHILVTVCYNISHIDNVLLMIKSHQVASTLGLGHLETR